MIIIDDNYAIETDSMGNYSLFRRKRVKKGKTAGTETKDYVGHFSSMRKAVMTYCRDRFNSETEKMEIPLVEAVKRLEKIEKEALFLFGFQEDFEEFLKKR